jgi:hypothetical protein
MCQSSLAVFVKYAKKVRKEQFLEETEGYFLGSGLTEALYDSWVIRDFAGIDMGEEKNLTRVRY